MESKAATSRAPRAVFVLMSAFAAGGGCSGTSQGLEPSSESADGGAGNLDRSVLDAGDPHAVGGDGGGAPCDPTHGGCGVDLTGKVYIVDSKSPCTSGCDGLTLATAWSSLGAVEAASLQTGADLCVMANSVFEDTTFRMSWGGTRDDRAVVGTCYKADDGGLYWWWEGPTPRSAIKAEVNGTFDQACIDAGWNACNPEGPGHVPPNANQGLVEIADSYVTLRALRIRDSAGRGIYFRGNAQTRNHLVELEVENIFGSNFFHLGPPPSTRHIVRNNVFRNAGYVYSSTWNPNGGAVGGTCFMLSRGTHVDKNQPAYDIFEGNILGNCSGEIGFLDSSHHIIRGNVFYNARNTGIYLDNVASSVVEWNITFLASDNCNITGNFGGANGCGPTAGGSSAQGGARWQIEDYPAGCSSPAACNQTTDSNDNVVRHNLYVWGEEGWGGSMEQHANAGNVLTMGKYYLHNTIYNATIRAWTERISGTQQLQGGLEVTNNVIVAAASAGPSRCFDQADRPAYSANVWSESAASLSNACKGAGDDYGASPGFVAPDPAGPPSLANRPTFARYSIVSGSGNGSASDLTTADVVEIATDCSNYPQLDDLDPTHGPEINWKPTCANWRKKGYYDFQGNRRGSGSDKGF